MGAFGEADDAFLVGLGNDILGVLADEGITNNVVVLGCSIGSKISLMLACEHPEIFGAAMQYAGRVRVGMFVTAGV